MGIPLASGAADPELQALARRAQSGDKQAQLELGIRYEEGRGVRTDYELAERLYRTASGPSGPAFVYAPPARRGEAGRVLQMPGSSIPSSVAAEAEARIHRLARGAIERPAGSGEAELRLSEAPATRREPARLVEGPPEEIVPTSLTPSEITERLIAAIETADISPQRLQHIFGISAEHTEPRFSARMLVPPGLSPGDAPIFYFQRSQCAERPLPPGTICEVSSSFLDLLVTGTFTDKTQNATRECLRNTDVAARLIRNGWSAVPRRSDPAPLTATDPHWLVPDEFQRPNGHIIVSPAVAQGESCLRSIQIFRGLGAS
jgi:hypothetical protein